MKELKFESNIPIPNYHSNNSVSSQITKMKVMDSVLVDSYPQATYIAQAIKKAGFIPVTRKVDNGVRVWKTTKPTKKK